MGKDYEKNAELLRKSLPASYEPMTLLNDAKTINILVDVIQSEAEYGPALKTLEIMGSREVLTGLDRLIKQDKISNLIKYREITSTAARISDRCAQIDA